MTTRMEMDDTAEEFVEDDEDMVGFLDGLEKMDIGEEERSSPPSRDWTMMVAIVTLLVASCVGALAFFQTSSNKASSSLNNNNDDDDKASSSVVSSSIEELRMEIALSSIDMMKQDTLQTIENHAPLDIGRFVDVFEIALDTIGVRGVLDGFIEVPEFVEAFNAAAMQEGISNLRATVGYTGAHGNLLVAKYSGLLTDRDLHDHSEDRCTGCLWWLRHYAGIVAADKFLREGSLLLEAGSDTRLESAKGIFQELIRIERVMSRPESMPIDFGHGFVWQLMMETMPTLDEYPLQLAMDLCGDVFYDVHVLEEGIQRDLGYECRHGFGHGVWVILANRDQPGLLSSVRSQPFPKWGFFLNKDSTCEGLAICATAAKQGDEFAWTGRDCVDGFGHMVNLMGDDRLTNPMVGQFFAAMCSDYK